ncbi:sugar kinase [Paroceanicella profunda]|uniref:Sugar kinase n=1 Tax=Paroceanicella profunda TaxID=2579971 RepID=A0A5B8FGT0_9RHOB|nr:sugar kinase [Paroceanicella profunda]QDL91357.1 sugar kinase [Paroceanicella profunda]
MSMAAAVDILALGEPLIEYNRAGDTPRTFLRDVGGDVSNFAIAAARQGARAGVLSALGADEHGDAIVSLWDAEGIDHAHVSRHASAPTGVYFVNHGPSGHVFSFLRASSAASLVGPADLPRAAIAGAKLLHFTGISLAISGSSCDACFEAAAIARAAGRRVSFDTNLRDRLWSRPRAKALIEAALAMTDIALPSSDDMEKIFGDPRPEAMAEHCLALGAKVVALKLGAEGALIATPEGRHRIPPAPCTPVDATGAGDTFGGSFVARLLAGDSPQEAGTYAAAAAALATQGYGAVAPIPRAEAVRAALGGK